MLPVAYVLFIALAVLGLLADGDRPGRYASVLVRVFAGAVATAAGVVAFLLLTTSDEGHTRPAIALLGFMLAGSLVYLSGLALWRGRLALLLRAGGWILLVASAIVPSTLSLALPILALLTVTISSAPTGRSTPRETATHAVG